MTRVVSSYHPCKADKSPACKHWKGRIYSDAVVLAAPLQGISAPSDLLVIDLDEYKGITTDVVDESLGCKLNWDQAFLQTTPQGGSHYVFVVPRKDMVRIKNAANVTKTPGFDLRVPHRGYICTGTGYRCNPMFPDTRWALENGNWPDLLPTALAVLTNRRPPKKQSKPPLLLCVNPPPDQIPKWTIPTQYGERNGRLLKLARWYKGQNPEATPEQLEAVLWRWYNVSEPHMSTKDFSTSLREFSAAYRLCTDPMHPSFAAIIDGYQKTHVPGHIRKLFTGAVIDAYKICVQLQKYHKNNDFFISSRLLGEVLNVSHVTAAKYLNALKDAGVSILKQAGKYTRKATRYASEYFMPSVASFHYLSEEEACNVRAAAASLKQETHRKTEPTSLQESATPADGVNTGSSKTVSTRASPHTLKPRKDMRLPLAFSAEC